MTFTIESKELEDEEWIVDIEGDDAESLLIQLVSAIDNEEIDDVNRYWRLRKDDSQTLYERNWA